jgi:CRISPR/Cas system-associated exonuclease Cas4 (RecB family)
MSEEKTEIADEKTEPIKDEVPKKEQDGSGDQSALKNVDPLAIGRRLKKDGDFVVEANYDPTLSPAYKALNDTHVALTQKINSERKATEKSIKELQAQLSENKTMAEGDKEGVAARLQELETNLSISQKDAKAAQVELLKVQTAAAKFLPYAYIKYVSGETSEEIAKSVDEVSTDFKLQTNKISKEDLDAAVATAAEAARIETAESLKTRGKNTEGGGAVDHVYTRAEIMVMSLAEYKSHRAEIEKQQNEGLIK